MGILCLIIPKLCSPEGHVGGPMGNPDWLPVAWKWLLDWMKTLDEAEDIPTLGELEVLANACLNAGYAESAFDIATEVLRNPGAFNGSLDPLTQANLQVISARSAAALSRVEEAMDLLYRMPSQSDLVEAVQRSEWITAGSIRS